MKTFNYDKNGGSQKGTDGITRLGSPTELEVAIKTKEHAAKWFSAQTKARYAQLQMAIATCECAQTESAPTDTIINLKRSIQNEDRLFQFFKLATEALEKEIGNGAH